MVAMKAGLTVDRLVDLKAAWKVVRWVDQWGLTMAAKTVAWRAVKMAG